MQNVSMAWHQIVISIVLAQKEQSAQRPPGRPPPLVQVGSNATARGGPGHGKIVGQDIPQHQLSRGPGPGTSYTRFGTLIIDWSPRGLCLSFFVWQG